MIAIGFGRVAEINLPDYYLRAGGKNVWKTTIEGRGTYELELGYCMDSEWDIYAIGSRTAMWFIGSECEIMARALYLQGFISFEELQDKLNDCNPYRTWKVKNER